jgi:hypothetical protein
MGLRKLAAGQQAFMVMRFKGEILEGTAKEFNRALEKAMQDICSKGKNAEASVVVDDAERVTVTRGRIGRGKKG